MYDQSKVCGVGVTDIKTNTDEQTSRAYESWRRMLSRCYSPAVHERRPNYIGCTVVHEWTIFSKFKKWYDENFKEGFHLDKDILVQNNKVYCPQYCRFIPAELNTLVGKKLCFGNLQGVSFDKESGKYKAHIRRNGKKDLIGRYDTQLEAFRAYKEAKEEYVKSVAFKYKEQGDIDIDVFNAIINYSVEV